jgi:hypothetical protein
MGGCVESRNHPIRSLYGDLWTWTDDVTLERRGKRWTQEEDDLLLALVRGHATLDQIAATLHRTALAVCARVDVLVGDDRLFKRTDEAFSWARIEIRKGDNGELAWAADRTDRVDVPVLEPLAAPVPPTQPAALTTNGGHGRKQSFDGTQMLRTWLSITGIQLTEDLRQRFLARRELNVLARFGAERLEAVGIGLWAAHGRLALGQ